VGRLAHQAADRPFALAFRESYARINVGRRVDVAGRTPDITEPATSSTPDRGMYAEPVLREERKALKSFRCLNSTADVARNG